MAKDKKLPKGVARTRTGKFRGSVTRQGVRHWSASFETAEEAAEALAEMRGSLTSAKDTKGSKTAASKVVAPPDNEAVRCVLSSVAFDELQDWANKQGGEAKGVIDASSGSEFDIWCQAAEICGVNLKPASEFFSWLNEIVFSAVEAQAALTSPGPFVSALRKVEASKVTLAHLNSVLRVAAMERRRVTLAQMLKVAQKVPVLA